jgi:hypothetical protein
MNYRTIMCAALLTACSGGGDFASGATEPTPEFDAGAPTSIATALVTGGASSYQAETGGTAAETTVAVTGGASSYQPPPTGGNVATGGSAPIATGGNQATGGNAATGGATQNWVGPATTGTATTCSMGTKCTGPLLCQASTLLACCNGTLYTTTDTRCKVCVPIGGLDSKYTAAKAECSKINGTLTPWEGCTMAPNVGCYMLTDGLACCPN